MLETTHTPRLIRLPEVVLRTGLSRSEIYRRTLAGTFPKPNRLSHKVAVWSEESVTAWVRSVIAAIPSDIDELIG